MCLLWWLWRTVTGWLSHGAARWPWRNISLAGCGRGRGRVGIHTGLDTVMKEGREWMAKWTCQTVACGGRRQKMNEKYMNMMDCVVANVVRMNISHAVWKRQLVDVFAAPPCVNCERQNSVKWCHYYTAYANQLCDQGLHGISIQALLEPRCV